jgi:hypothetical protein
MDAHVTGAFPRRVGHEKPVIFVQTHLIAQKIKDKSHR